MKGYVKKRAEGSYSIVLYLGRDPATGKKRYKWQTLHGNKKQAESELNRLLRELDTGAYVEPTRLTVGDFLKKWLEDSAKVKVAAKTFERYAGIITKHLAPALGIYPLAKLQPLQIQEYYARALQVGRQDGRKGGLSAQTVLHHHRVLREALQQAVRWQLIARNPADAVEPPRPERREIEPIDELQTAWLIDAAAGTRLYIPILLAVTTGMRRGEILALRWHDLNLSVGSIIVRRSLEQTKEGGLRFKDTKSHRARPIRLPALAVEALRLHQSEQEGRKETLGPAYEENKLVCCVEDGTIWKPAAFTSAYRDLLRRRKINPIRFHDLRHSHASQLLRAGINAKVIQERLGHSRVAFTLDVYSHLFPGMQEEAASCTDTALRSALAKKRLPVA